MDMKDASAMTEASGLTNEQPLVERTPGRKLDATAAEGSSQGSSPPFSDLVTQWAGQLREQTAKAPLRSLTVAFLLGVWFARRR
jgi:hypothetical protein